MLMFVPMLLYGILALGLSVDEDASSGAEGDEPSLAEENRTFVSLVSSSQIVRSDQGQRFDSSAVEADSTAVQFENTQQRNSRVSKRSIVDDSHEVRVLDDKKLKSLLTQREMEELRKIKHSSIKYEVPSKRFYIAQKELKEQMKKHSKKLTEPIPSTNYRKRDFIPTSIRRRFSESDSAPSEQSIRSMRVRATRSDLSALQDTIHCSGRTCVFDGGQLTSGALNVVKRATSSSNRRPQFGPRQPSGSNRWKAIRRFPSKRRRRQAAAQYPPRRSRYHRSTSHHIKPEFYDLGEIYEPVKRSLPDSKEKQDIQKYYIGCFIDIDTPERDLPVRANLLSVHPLACVSFCKKAGFIYAAVQYGYLCFCGNTFGKYDVAPEKSCNTPCLGDSSQTCGGYWRNAVYRCSDLPANLTLSASNISSSAVSEADNSHHSLNFAPVRPQMDPVMAFQYMHSHRGDNDIVMLPTQPPTVTPSIFVQPGTFLLKGEIKLKQNWYDDLLMSSSSKYQILAGNVEQAIRDVYQLEGSFLKSEVLRFREGLLNNISNTVHKTIVDFTISFRNNVSSKDMMSRLSLCVANHSRIGYIPVYPATIHLEEYGRSLSLPTIVLENTSLSSPTTVHPFNRTSLESGPRLFDTLAVSRVFVDTPNITDNRTQNDTASSTPSPSPLPEPSSPSLPKLAEMLSAMGSPRPPLYLPSPNTGSAHVGTTGLLAFDSETKQTKRDIPYLLKMFFWDVTPNQVKSSSSGSLFRHRREESSQLSIPPNTVVEPSSLTESEAESVRHNEIPEKELKRHKRS